MTAYVLIVYLAAGGLRVSMSPDLYTCIARSQFEIRYDPQVLTACVPHSGDQA